MEKMTMIPKPVKLNPVNGRATYRFTVCVSQSGVEHRNEIHLHVVAHSPAEACNLIRDELSPRVERPTEIETTGPRGGRTRRFIGWDSLIGGRLLGSRPSATQLELEVTS